MLVLDDASPQCANPPPDPGRCRRAELRRRRLRWAARLRRRVPGRRPRRRPLVRRLRKIADKVAAAGFFVVVPDFLYGDPYVLGSPVQVWLNSHSLEKGFEDAKQVISAVKNKGVSTIGAVGFCWGAKVVTELAKAAEIQAGVLLHPAFVTVDDIKEVKSHLAILGAEIDSFSPPALVKEFEQVLASISQFESFAKIFPGVVHGWSVRYQSHDEVAVKKAEEAHQDLLDWFNKNLKKAI